MRLIIFDVDGVFTDGRIWQDSQGQWRRVFGIRDAIGIKNLHKAGIPIAVVTEARSADVRYHMANLRIQSFDDGCVDKTALVQRILERQGVEPWETGLMTADIRDAALVRTLGFGLTVASAPAGLREICAFVSPVHGGDGAVFTACQWILENHKLSSVSGSSEPSRSSAGSTGSSTAV